MDTVQAGVGLLLRRLSTGPRERGRVEAALRESEARLRVAVAEQKRLEEELLASQKLEAVGRLAGGIAHDFNNLLTVISGYSGFALSRIADSDPKLRADVEAIVMAAEQAVELTRSLLPLNRPEAPATQLVDLNDIVTDTEKLLNRVIGDHIEVRTELEPGLGPVRADPGQIEQVLLNLAVNAREAMENGGVLTLRTANVDLDETAAAALPDAAPGAYATISVSDDGQGMDEDTQAHAFKPFFTTKESGDGAGLGLSTVDSIVRDAGGFATLSSEPGGGSTFVVSLPRVVDDAEGTETEQPEAARGTERILLVEDDSQVRELVLTILNSHGYEVDDADSPETALAMLADRSDYDLLLTYVFMPKMNGAELADRVSELQPGIRVLYISGYTGDAVIDTASLAPGRAFVQKPFNARSLSAKIRELLDAGKTPVAA